MMGLLGAFASGAAGTTLQGIQDEKKQQTAVDLMQLEHSLDMQLKEVDQGYKAEGREQSHGLRMEEMEYSADRQDARAATSADRQDARAARRGTGTARSGKKEWIKETIVGDDGSKRTIVTGYYDDAGYHPVEGGATGGVGAAQSAEASIEDRMAAIWGERKPPSTVKKEPKREAAKKPRNLMMTDEGFPVSVKPLRGAL